MYPMNDDLRQAASMMSAGQYFEAASAFRAIYQSQPDHAAMAASQVGAALFFLRDFKDAIAWYQEAGRLGFDARMIQDNIQEAQQAMNQPYTPNVGDVVLFDNGQLMRFAENGTWQPLR
ncbi:MAG: hypothetical protein AAGE52_19405 [Myxococcota bacterium]